MTDQTKPTQADIVDNKIRPEPVYYPNKLGPQCNPLCRMQPKDGTRCEYNYDICIKEYMYRIESLEESLIETSGIVSQILDIVSEDADSFLHLSDLTGELKAIITKYHNLIDENSRLWDLIHTITAIILNRQEHKTKEGK